MGVIQRGRIVECHHGVVKLYGRIKEKKLYDVNGLRFLKA